MPDEEVTFYCNECEKRVRHTLITPSAQYSDSEIVDKYGTEVSGGTDVETWKCNACDAITVRTRKWCSENTDSEYGSYNYEDQLFPYRHKIQHPLWVEELTEKHPKLSSLIQEIHVAFDAGAPSLSALGCRTVIDRILADKYGDGDFKERLNKLYADGHISQDDKEEIECILEPGHGVAHRGYTPNDGIKIVIQAVDMLVEKIYIRPIEEEKRKAKLKALKATVPPRKD